MCDVVRCTCVWHGTFYMCVTWYVLHTLWYLLPVTLYLNRCDGDCTSILVHVIVFVYTWHARFMLRIYQSMKCTPLTIDLTTYHGMKKVDIYLHVHALRSLWFAFGAVGAHNSRLRRTNSRSAASCAFGAERAFCCWDIKNTLDSDSLAV